MVPRHHGPGIHALAGLLLIAAACGRGNEGASENTEVIAVTVQAARVGSLRDTVSVPGNVVPSVVGDFLVTANEASEIAELPKNEGDIVKAGDLLVRLEVASITNNVATAQLELSEATNRLEAAKAEEAKLEPLVTQGLAARNKLEAARLARAAAETAFHQVKARFDAAKSLEGGSSIRARFAGVVIKRWHGRGDLVTGGESDPIMRVIDPTRMQIAIQVPRQQIDRINQGQPAVVQTGTGTEPAVVAMKGTAASESMPTVEVRLTVTSAAPLALDSIVQTEIVLEELQNVILIPAGSVQRGDKGPFVWVVSNGQATKREVRIGLTVTGMTQVLSGVNDGDLIVTTGISQLSEGTPVTITK